MDKIKKLPITNTGQEAIIDAEDGHRVSHVKKWYTITLERQGYKTVSVVGNTGHKGGDFTSPQVVYLRRVITNCPKDKIVRHINGNSLDCRKENLEVLTRSEWGKRKRNYHVAHTKNLGESKEENIEGGRFRRNPNYWNKSI